MTSMVAAPTTTARSYDTCPAWCSAHKNGSDGGVHVSAWQRFGGVRIRLIYAPSRLTCAPYICIDGYPGGNLTLAEAGDLTGALMRLSSWTASGVVAAARRPA